MAKVKFNTRGLALAEETGGEEEGLAPGASWDSVLVIEGVQTLDLRMMEKGSLDWRELPLTLMGMVETQGGHQGAQVCGRIDTITRDKSSGEIAGTGVFDTGEYGQEIQRMVADRVLRGVSVDVMAEEIEFREPEGYDGPPMDEWDLMWEGVMVVLKGTILAATVCPMQAFDDADIAIAASCEVITRKGEPVVLRFTFPFDAETMTAAAFQAEKVSPAIVGERVGIPAPADGTPVTLKLTLPAPLDGVTASAAGLAPVHPPAEWFEIPEADGPTPITVDDDGRVYGHAALWGTCHIGRPGCTTPPRSESSYAYFNLGEVVTAEGSRVSAGKITLGTGHADLRASRQETMAHYDDTGTVVADVVCRDGKHGPWVSGALRPDVDASRVRELRAAPVSGDWRPTNGHLELVGLLAVNVPGFPVPRQRALAASAGQGDYETVALVAAGILTPERVARAKGALAELRARAVYPNAMRDLATRARG